MATRTVEILDLPVTTSGTQRRLKVIRYGDRGGRPKAYFQTGLHADEIPGMLVVRRLDQLLDHADRQGDIKGEIILVPVANPVGLSQQLLGQLAGRFELGRGVNFNRGYPDVTGQVAQRIERELTLDATHNVSIIRKHINDVIDEYDAPDEVGSMRKALMRLSADADICLDLHCDWEAVLHLYLGTPLWPQASDLAAQLGSEATLLAEVSGGNPFDEAVGGIWWALAKQYPEYPIPPACLSGTVEYRGGRDVSHHLAESDANNLYRFLMRRGLVAGDPGPLPELITDATPLEGVDPIRAPHAGVVVYLKQPGDRVEAGEALAEVVDPWSDSVGATGSVLKSRVSGVLFSHRLDRFARPGQALCRVAGSESLPDRIGGHLLSE